MSSTIPPWKAAIENALAKHDKSSVIQIATIGSNAHSPNHDHAQPRVRSHIFRSFLAPQNDPSSPLLLTTTDIRTPKVKQLIANPSVELAWWIDGSQEQFRILGVAKVVPDPTNADEKDAYRAWSDFVKQSQDAGNTTASGTSLNGFVGLVKEGFDWESQRREQFDNMNPAMKASWCRPTPGTPILGNVKEESRRWPLKLFPPGDERNITEGAMASQEEAQRNWDKAIRNFALVVVEPSEVDYVELGVVPNRRTRFWRSETEVGRWEEQALVP
ncbi:hypothetical protein AX16_001260 [Volvariella volvacea WC 439]|nr:hypothetical protein AX16_001260 [Volvariella volvacea WC 439]